jgi:hypothetical protein
MRVGRNPRTASRVIDGRAIVISVDQNRLYTLNPTASRIWESLGNGSSVEELAAELCKAYQVDSARARHDCQRLCDELTRIGLTVCRP